MQYGQIVFFLFILLLAYYAVLIALDIQKARAASAAEQENQEEEDIDITDEAESFRPVLITREETVWQPKLAEPPLPSDRAHETLDEGIEDAEDTELSEDEITVVEPAEDTEADGSLPGDTPVQDEAIQDEAVQEGNQARNEEAETEIQPDEVQAECFQPSHYREAIMTDGIPVEHLIEEINRLAETGESDLGQLIYSCEEARQY